MSLWTPSPSETQKEVSTVQKQRIEQLISDIKWIQNRREALLKDLREMQPKAEFYLEMQRRITKDKEGGPALAEAMQRFLMIMRLTLSEDIRGLTTR